MLNIVDVPEGPAYGRIEVAQLFRPTMETQGVESLASRNGFQVVEHRRDGQVFGSTEISVKSGTGSVPMERWGVRKAIPDTRQLSPGLGEPVEASTLETGWLFGVRCPPG